MEIRQHFDNTFYNDFYKRVSIFLNYYEHLFGNSKIILSIISDRQVFYKGLDCIPIADTPENRETLEFLKFNGYSVSDKRYLTARLHKKFNNKNLTSHDFGPVDLQPFIKTGESALKQHEKRLIQACISAASGKNYSCISIPLIAMASFVGAVNILWQPRNNVDINLLLSSVEVLTKMCTREYESMLVFRDLDFLDEAKNIELKHQYDLLTRKSQLHPFLSKLGYPDYYRVFGEQFLRYNKKIIDVKNKVDSQDIKTAIISIVVDSFAHNVGAHSLTALKWWIQKRSEFLNYKFKFGKEHHLSNFSPQQIGFEHLRQISKNHTDFYKKIGRKDMKKSLTSLMSIIKHMPPELEQELLTFETTFRDYKNQEQGSFIPRFPIPIDDGIWPFLEYMRDKSAFWSGVSRDIVYTGEAISWYDLIWGDFINNPLFLGTIAHSEGIHKLNVFLKVIDKEGQTVKEGLFAKIDLSVIGKEIAQVEGLYNDGNEAVELEHEISNDLEYSTYGFIRLAEGFTELKEALEALPEVFLPNGIIGKHAFYTILENTLRNVKHFKDEYLNMQQNGINFHISIQPHAYEDRERDIRVDEENLFEVGVWLQHPIYLIHKTHNATSNKPIYFKYYERLSESIVNQYGRPNLGGNSQDKICAAMLLNNTFKSVVENNPEEAKVGYRPYVHIESKITSDLPEDDNGIYRPPLAPLNAVQLSAEANNYLNRFPIGSMGYIKKYLYMWKAESLNIVDDKDFDVRAENLSRFRIIAAKNISLPEAKDKFRLHGVIRIVSYESIKDAPTDSEARFAYAYLMWLREWLNWQEGEQIQTLISIRNTPVGLLVLDEQGEVSYKNYMDLYGNFDMKTFTGRRIELSHGDQQGRGSQQLCEIRSHGTFLKYFYNGNGFSGINNYQFAKQSLLIELFEAIDTKVCVIDNRVHKRMPDNKQKAMEDQLNLHVYPEKDAVWQQEIGNMLKGCNFLILHLSFIESFAHQKYTANQIDEFVNKEIGMLEELPENFIVVITTGRGRSGWLETIENPKITFRPIESLVDALEDGLSMQDFFQIKYNLVKVLMGS